MSTEPDFAITTQEAMAVYRLTRPTLYRVLADAGVRPFCRGRWIRKQIENALTAKTINIRKGAL